MSCLFWTQCYLTEGGGGNVLAVAMNNTNRDSLSRNINRSAFVCTRTWKFVLCFTADAGDVKTKSKVWESVVGVCCMRCIRIHWAEVCTLLLIRRRLDATLSPEYCSANVRTSFCYLRRRRRLCFSSVCLSVCPLDYSQTFRRGRAWLKDQVIQFWWRSVSGFGSGSPKSEIRILWIGGGLCSLSIHFLFHFIVLVAVM